jgi:outer membrane protein OmpA-like peptidoglycan-associated protein
MAAPESARPSGGMAQAVPTGLRTTLAVGLLVLGAGDLAAIDAILLPHYLSARSHGAPRATLQAHVWEPPAPLPVSPPRPQAVAAPPVVPAPAVPPAAPTAAAPPVVPAPAAPPAASTAAAPPVAPQATTAPAPDETVPIEANAAAETSDWPPLRFARNTTWLSPESRDALAELAQRLVDHPNLQAVLAGHTDDLGAPERNRSLSLDRALRVRRYLIGHGVARDRVEVQSFGSSRPVASGRSREARAQNRRVEITLQERSD